MKVVELDDKSKDNLVNKAVNQGDNDVFIHLFQEKYVGSASSSWIDLLRLSLEHLQSYKDESLD